jgi:hypothetical protein
VALELAKARRQNGPGRAERRAIRRGEGDHAAHAPLVMAEGLERLTGSSDQEPDKREAG